MLVENINQISSYYFVENKNKLFLFFGLVIMVKKIKSLKENT